MSIYPSHIFVSPNLIKTEILVKQVFPTCYKTIYTELNFTDVYCVLSVHTVAKKTCSLGFQGELILY